MNKSIKKWDFRTKKYKQYKPTGKRLALYSNKMEELIDCADCGKELEYGDGYTSKAIHTEMGFGYSVCEDCYDRELKAKELWG